jgi:hypothetical protein
MTLLPNTPDFWAALGACGLQEILDEPFIPFVVIFEEEGERFAYKILDPRAVEIDVDNSSYTIGLAINEMKGVKDTSRAPGGPRYLRNLPVVRDAFLLVRREGGPCEQRSRKSLAPRKIGSGKLSTGKLYLG